MTLTGDEGHYAKPHHRSSRRLCCARGALQAIGGGMASLLLTLLLPHTAVSQPTLQPPVTPACVSSPFGWRHAVGPHAPAGFHNGIDLPARAGALVHAAAAGTVEVIKRQGLGGVTVHLCGIRAVWRRCTPTWATLCPRLPRGSATLRPGRRWGTWRARV
jgi:hypothetical protein